MLSSKLISLDEGSNLSLFGSSRMSQGGKIDEARKVYYPSNGPGYSPIEQITYQSQPLQSHGYIYTYIHGHSHMGTYLRISSRFEQHYGHNPVDDVTILPYLHCLQTLISGNINSSNLLQFTILSFRVSQFAGATQDCS